jgi:hypothetical protein
LFKKIIIKIGNVNFSQTLQLGRDNVSLAGVVGEPYGTIFHMVPDPANRNRAIYL